MNNNNKQPKQGGKPAKGKQSKPPGPKQQQACKNEKKKKVSSSAKAAVEMVKVNGKLEKEEKMKVFNSTLLLPLIGRGLSRDAFPLELTPNTTLFAMMVLSVTSYCMAFLPKGLATQANALIGCFWEDAQLAMKGMRSKFQQAPRVWWEMRQAWVPCTSKSYSFNFDTLGSTITYSAANSFYIIGNQFTTTFGPGTTAPAFTPYTAAIDVASADYEIASDVFAYAGKGLKVGPNMFENVKNHDPSAFGLQINCSGNNMGFGACASSTVLPMDYNRYCRVLPRSRFNASLCLVIPTASNTLTPLGYSIMTASASTEIGHRMFCDFIKAPEEVRECLPVCVRVDINSLITRTMNLIQKSFIDGGVSVGAITAFGSYDMAAYLFCAICEWFGPWSQVTYPRGYVNGIATFFLNITSGCLIQNMWNTKPIPGALAVNLSHLIPCCDMKLKRVYYPSLDLSNFAFTNFPIATYTVFSAIGSGGVTPWTSLTTTQWAAFYDTTGVIAQTLTSNAGSCPMRTLPHTSKVLSLACHVQMNWIESATTIYVVASSHPPSDEERELYTLMVLPTFANATIEQFYEYARFFGMRELTVLPVANDNASYLGFGARNGNVLGTTAKVYLDKYDRAQEEDSGMFGFVGTVTTMMGALGATGAYVNRGSIQRMGENALAGYVLNRMERDL